VICVVVTEVTEPNQSDLLPLPLVMRVTTTWARAAGVEDETAGALTMMVPAPTSPLAFSSNSAGQGVKVPVSAIGRDRPPPVAAVNWAPLTAMAGLVLGLLLPSVRSVAVRVKLPLALK
jgi:hypothetical protein